MFGIKKFLIGLKIVPKTASTADSKGDLEVIDSTGKLGFHNGTSVSPVVTESHASALTNKTIDADSNTITNIEDADIKAAAAIDASKLADGSVSNTEFQYISTVTSNVQDQLDSKATATGLSDHINDTVDAHDASAISVSAISGLTATEVQAALAEHQVEIENVVSDLGAHILDTVDAHDASAISNVPSGNLAATDIQGAVDELQSDIDTRATSSALSAHTGASSGVHGVVGSVVGTSDSQTLTNKTISGASIQAPIRSDVKQDTKANLTTYALTATNGQLVFATDTKEMFQVVDTLLEAVGGGAGIGGVDILFSQTFEEAAITDFTQTGLSLSASSPIHGAISALMTHQAVANQSFKQVVAVDEKFRGQAMLLELNVKSTASAGNVTLNVYDETNAANIVASEQLTLSSATGGIKDFVAFTIPAACLSLSYTITALPEAGSPVTRIDDIICQLNNAALLETSVTVPRAVLNQYSALFDGATAAKLSESLTGWITSTTDNGTGDLLINYSGLGLASIPVIQATVEWSGGVKFAGVVNVTTTTARITSSTVAGTLTDPVKYNVTLNKQGLDFTNPLTATSDVAIPLTQSGIVQEADSALYAAGNAGQSVTSIVTDIPFIPVSSRGSDISFTGSTFSVAESGIYSITGATRQTVSGSQNVRLHKNGTYVMSIGYDAASLIHPFATVTYLDSGATYSIRLDSSATLSNSSDHALTITRQGSLKQVTVNTNSKITIPTSELRFEGASARGAVATAIVKFDTMAKIRGDAFTVTNTANDGTFVTMTKAGKLDVSASIYASLGTYLYLSKNQTTLTTTPSLASEIMASSGGVDAADPIASVVASISVAIGDVIRIASSGSISANTGNILSLYFQEQDIQVSVSNTIPQFSESDSSVRVDTANGYGSTATKIRRFSNVRDNIGVDVVYADSATAGASFTVMESGIYEVTYSDSMNAGYIGLSKNSSQLTTSIISITAADRLAVETVSGAGEVGNCAWSGYLAANDIIRPHSDGFAGGSAAWSNFTISKVGKPNVTGVDVTPFVITQFDKGSIGEIKAFAGNVDAMHYLECDGRAVSRGSYSDLFAAIGITHGQGDGSLTFNIPDYRGRFLRGTSGAATLDPDKLTRTAMNTGGNAGNLVGSVQADAFASHNHSFSKNSNLANGGGSAFTTSGTVGDTISRTLNDATGGNETRPENAYVNYGIRFKAANEAILTETDTFSTDTAALTYAGSGTYTLATLANAPVGTYITFTHAINSNTRVQTASPSRPTQTDADMNANGIFVQLTSYNVVSTSATPSVFAIQIGKGLKGVTSQILRSIGKVNAGDISYYVTGTNKHGALVSYNEVTGVYVVDGRYDVLAASTSGNSYFTFGDASIASSGYLVINASKNPALTGLGIDRVAARAVSTSGQSISTGVNTTVLWDAAKTFDTTGSLNSATGIYTVSETGYYQVSANITYSNITTQSTINTIILKNGAISSLVISITQNTAASYGAAISDCLFLNKGDTVSIQTNHNTGSSKVLNTSGSVNFFSIAKVSV